MSLGWVAEYRSNGIVRYNANFARLARQYRYEGILPCNLNVSDTENYWDVCYNGSDSTLPPDYNPYYNTPVPEGEKPSQGGPNSESLLSSE